MDEKMLKAGGDVKRRELIKQFEDLSLEQQVDRTKMNEEEEFKAVKGDKYQAERLLAQKRGFSKQ
jgi:hypothetical protein